MAEFDPSQRWECRPLLPDHDGMWTIIVVRRSYHTISGPRVVATVESPIFSAEPVVGTVEDFVYGCGETRASLGGAVGS